jgi:D-glycerate 3-kinase
MDAANLWPDSHTPLSPEQEAELLAFLQPLLGGQLALNQLPSELAEELPRLYLPLAAWLNQQRQPGRPLLVGLNGSQGSGKSTLCALIKWLLEAAFDCHACIISIDDLYLPKAERNRLGETIHPLLATRGVPGTHDVPLGLTLLKQLKSAEPGDEIELPRFSKALDDRLPTADWEHVTAPVDLILFEGWCVGARPQTKDALQQPINSLEEKEDAEGAWRHYVNQQLEGPYRELFALIDLQIMLHIPDWQLVYHWRKRQELQLAAKQSGSGVMGEVALQRFIMHYERLTRHQLQNLPEHSQLVLCLNEHQRVTELKFN